MSTWKMKMVSSLEKCFLDEKIEDKQEKNEFTIFRNERLSFQVLCYNTEPLYSFPRHCPIKLCGALAKYAKVSQVVHVPVTYPTFSVDVGGEFLRKTPGVYPDLIRPLRSKNTVSFPSLLLHSLWVDIDLPAEFEAGVYDIGVILKNSDKKTLGKVMGKVRVIGADLPEQKLIHTEWFYTDCIADFYGVKPFSEKHWRYIENFMLTAVKNGINMILTPVFTPELDTYIGGERTTTQLVDIEKTPDGKYVFGFDKLHRWIDLCEKCGVKYYEIPHFFTQWGAKAAPKIVVKVDGKSKKLFGWHTDSMGKEYGDFLDQFIPALLSEFKKRGHDKNCFFHVSDEPSLDHLEQYVRCKNLIAKHLAGYPIIDALSNFEFYSKGVLDKPVPHTRGADVFIRAGVPNLWVYYCGGGKGGVSDRSMSMPSRRTRILGAQLYYYDIEGFLHWGYNYYNNMHSYNTVDPFGTTDGEGFTPAGDEFLVYPGENGKPLPSMRLNALREAVDDMRALSLYEEKFGKEAAKKLLLEGTDGSLTFTHYPTSDAYFHHLRETIAERIAEISK